jgi:hypothetical protein
LELNGWKHVEIALKLKRPHYDLTGIMVNKGNQPQMAIIRVSEIL